MPFGTRTIGALVPHRGQGLREKVTPQRLFLFVKIQSATAATRIMTTIPMKKEELSGMVTSL
jgi:hypothetical protein